MKPWPLTAERQLLAEACVPGRHPHSLWNFIRYAAGWHFRCIDFGNYWLTDTHKEWLTHIDEMFLDWYAARKRGDSQPLFIMNIMFRGSGKSNLLTQNIASWWALREPNLSSYIGSATVEDAGKFFVPIRNMLAGEDPMAWFSWFYGIWRDTERTWNRSEIEIAVRTSRGLHEPSIGIFGAETGITGTHPTMVVNDDPVTLEKLKEGRGNWLRICLDSHDSIQNALRDDSVYILTMTPYHDEDTRGYALSIEGVKSWWGLPQPEKYPEGPWNVCYLPARDIRNTTNYPQGEPTLPRNRSHAKLLELEQKKPYQYASQYMLNPTSQDHRELDEVQVQRMKIPRAELPKTIEYATIHMDTAFKTEKTRGIGDNNAIVVWLHDARATGIIYLDSTHQSNKWGVDDVHTKLVNIMTDLRGRGIYVKAITDEAEMGGKKGTYAPLLRKTIMKAGLRVPQILQFTRGGKKKIARIRIAAGYWVEGYARLVDDCAHLNELTREMTGIGLTKYDDLSDAAADGFHPDVWRGPQHGFGDEEPDKVHQPGDEHLKNQRYAAEIEDIRRQIRGEDTELHEDPEPEVTFTLQTDETEALFAPIRR